uniref:Obtusifoliol 14-alpha demethylase n=2 Tax=Oryza meridionalis TaxID=40149 RepID=A0A0E0EB00_9ORYZ
MDHVTSSTIARGAMSWVAATVALLLTTAVILTALQKRKISSPAAAAPPVVRGAGLVRFARAMARDGPLEAIREQQAKLGSVFTAIAPFGLFKVTFLIGPEVSSHFYLAPESEMGQGSIYRFTVPLFGPEVGYAVDPDTRAEQMRLFWDVLKPRSIEARVGAMAEEVQNYFSRWGEQGTVDLKKELERVPMLIASRCLLGREVRESMVDEVYELFRDLDNGLHLISTMLPYLPTPAHRRRDRARQRLGEIFTEVIRSRRNSGTADNGDDVLQRLIDGRYKDERALTDVEVVGLLVVLVFAGKHSSSSVSTWTGINLLSHPNHLAAVIAEQDRLMASRARTDDDHDRVNYDTMQEMTTLHRCIKEALQLHPPAVAMFRQARKHFTVQTKEGKEYTIPGGHTVLSTILVNHHMPNVYKDPHVFDPSRFARGRGEDRAAGPFSFLAFGAGRHSCAGESFAYTQIKVIWSHLLRNFELKMVSPFPETSWRMVTPEPKGTVMIRYRRRNLTCK